MNRLYGIVEGPIGPKAADGWKNARTRNVERFFVVCDGWCQNTWEYKNL